MQAHFGADPVQRPGLKMRSTHPRLERSERMFKCMGRRAPQCATAMNVPALQCTQLPWNFWDHWFHLPGSVGASQN